MKQLNKHINSTPVPRMRLTVNEGDNYIQVVGTDEGGQVDKAYSKDDPQCEEKVRSEIERLKSYQRQQLLDQVDEVIPDFDNKVEALDEHVNEYFNSQNQ